MSMNRKTRGLVATVLVLLGIWAVPKNSKTRRPADC